MDTRVNGVSLDGGGMSNPMTTLGDLITGGASGTPGRLAVGAEGEVLTAVSGEPAWAPAPSGGIDTSLQAAPDTGWTAADDGTAAITSGVLTATVTAAQTGARLHRPTIGSIYLPAVELMARVTLATAPGSGDYRQYLAVTNATDNRGYRVQIQSDGLVYLFRNGGSWVSVGTAAHAALWTGGTLWLRLIVTAGGAAAFQGVAAGPAPPSSWTPVASTDGAAVGGVIAAGEVGVMAVAASRTGGTGDLVATAQNIQWRSLLGAPT